MSKKKIICQDCGEPRWNARYANTLYCNSDRLLRDLLYVGKEQRPCAACTKPFAPANRKDTLCGECHYGSIYVGPCAFCKVDAELHRPSIPLCIKCLRQPSLRRSIISGLRKGQRERRAANGLPSDMKESQ